MDENELNPESERIFLELKKNQQASDEEIKNLRMKNIKDEIKLFKAICGEEVLNDN